MQVILLEKVRNLGALGDKVNVKAGYGRNYLVPYGKAVYATKANLEKFESRRAELEKLEAQKLQAALERKATIEALGSVTINTKAGEEGKLFGSIGTRDITDALNNHGIAVAKSEVELPTGSIRQTGTYDITIALDSDIDVVVKVNVVSLASSHD